jgi:hypothetical protein
VDVGDFVVFCCFSLGNVCWWTWVGRLMDLRDGCVTYRSSIQAKITPMDDD